MKVTQTELEGVVVIEPEVFNDNRGWFMESYSKTKFEKYGIDNEFIQDNHSYSKGSNILRGLHFQKLPHAQAKLVRCTRGKILDVAVDLRKGSPDYKRWISVELSDENKKQLYIPKGFAHGFLTLSEDVEVQYKVDEYYCKECDRSIRYDDPDIGVYWGIDDPILSEKDLNAPFLKDSDVNFSIRVLVTGANGQLGTDLVKALEKNGFDVIATTRKDFDLTNYADVENIIKTYRPDVVIHTAAYTKVDDAERNKEQCYNTNVIGTENIAKAVREINSRLVFISTDYVFDGNGDKPIHENTKTNPINYYGYTKAEAEKLVMEITPKSYIVRTSWLYGLKGDNFVKKMLKLSEERDSIMVVNDQIGSPTYTKDLADFLINLIKTKKYGIYHGVNEGYCSWYEFAKKIFELSKKEVEVMPIESSKFETLAKRPSNSRLSTDFTDKMQLNKLPSWEDAIYRYIEELKENNEL